MAGSMQQAANRLAQAYPEIYACAAAVYRAGGRIGLVASRAAALGDWANSLPPADDHDFQVHPDDFDLAVQIFGAQVECDKQITLLTGRGEVMQLVVDEATVCLGGGSVQFMRPHGPARIGDRLFDTSFSDEAAAACQLYWTEGGLVPVAHPAETITLYGLRQGRGKKSDAARAAMVWAARDPRADAHLSLRARQVGWDDSLKAFAARIMRRAVSASPVFAAAA